MVRFRVIFVAVLIGGCGSSITGSSLDHTVGTSFSMTMVQTRVLGANTCKYNVNIGGTLQVAYTQQSDGSVRGHFQIRNATQAATLTTGTSQCPTVTEDADLWNDGGDFTSSSSAVTFSKPQTGTVGSITITSKISFTGTLSNDIITGTLQLDYQADGTLGGAPNHYTGTSSTSVTLR